MPFHEAPLVARKGAMGDQAEAVFEKVYPEGFARYGINRPPVRVQDLPAFVRFTPDYLTSKGLVEVQGFGSDQLVKFKVDKLAALYEWHERFRVDFFIFDSKKNRYGWVRLPDLDGELEHVGRLDSFHDGNKFYGIKAADLPLTDGWHDIDGEHSAKR